MVRDAAAAVAAGQAVEPPQTEGRQQLALAGDARAQDMVERADAVARDHEHAVGAGRGVVGGNVEVADLARIDVPPAGKVEKFGHLAIIAG